MLLKSYCGLGEASHKVQFSYGQLSVFLKPFPRKQTHLPAVKQFCRTTRMWFYAYFARCSAEFEYIRNIIVRDAWVWNQAKIKEQSQQRTCTECPAYGSIYSHVYSTTQPSATSKRRTETKVRPNWAYFHEPSRDHAALRDSHLEHVGVEKIARETRKARGLRRTMAPFWCPKPKRGSSGGPFNGPPAAERVSLISANPCSINQNGWRPFGVDASPFSIRPYPMRRDEAITIEQGRCSL